MLKKYKRDVQRYFYSTTNYTNSELLYMVISHPALRIMFLGRLSEKWGGVISKITELLMKRKGIEIAFSR